MPTDSTRQGKIEKAMRCSLCKHDWLLAWYVCGRKCAPDLVMAGLDAVKAAS